MRCPLPGSRATQFGGAVGGLFEHLERFVEFAAQVVDLADHVQGAGAAGEALGVEILGALRGVVGEGFLADRVEGGEPAVGFEFLAQVADHEFDQALGVAALVDRVTSRGDRDEGGNGEHDDQGQ